MFIDFCLRHFKATLILWAALIASSLIMLGWRLASPAPLIDNSVGVWFMKDDPDLALYEDYNRVFGQKEWSILLLKTPSIYDPAFLRDLSAITLRMSRLGH